MIDWLADFLNTVNETSDSIKAGNFISSCETITFLRKTLCLQMSWLISKSAHERGDLHSFQPQLGNCTVIYFFRTSCDRDLSPFCAREVRVGYPLYVISISRLQAGLPQKFVVNNSFADCVFEFSPSYELLYPRLSMGFLSPLEQMLR
jgi:hypothetical protein